MPQTLIELGGQASAPILHMAVANGFPPQTYIPMLRPLMSDYRVLSFPPRALWGDQEPPNTYSNWSFLGEDLLSALDDHDMQNVVAVGHSFGAIGTMLGLIQHPQVFRALILLDPTILMPNILDMINMAWQQNMVDQIPLVQGAMRRRRDFDGPDDAYERFREKRFFASWSDEALRYYADYGTKARADGSGYTLAWSPEWEAYYFSTVHNTIWDELSAVNGLVPTLIVRGGESDTFVAQAEDRVKTLIPSAEYRTVEGHGHLFPQTAPTVTGELIKNWLSAL